MNTLTMLARLNFKKPLTVQLVTEAKPLKFNWKELGVYFAEHAYEMSKQDVKSMRTQSKWEVYPKFLNAPMGVRLLSTGFYLFNSYRSLSPLFKNDVNDKNLKEFFTGIQAGLEDIRLIKKAAMAFNAQQAKFVVNYVNHLRNHSQSAAETQYAESLYRLYESKNNKDPLIIEEKKALSDYMQRRRTNHSQYLSRSIKIQLR